MGVMEKHGKSMENLWSIDWFCWEKLQENPMIFMGKSLWFPVNFPINQSIDIWKITTDHSFTATLSWTHIPAPHIQLLPGVVDPGGFYRCKRIQKWFFVVSKSPG